jgi:AcrR family transcriptional regulator
MSTRSPGRPRSEQARQAVLAAAVRLIEEDGYGSLTIEAIALRAGVSKQTIYRWWSGKADIVLDALEESSSQTATAPDSGSLESDLRVFLRRAIADMAAGNAELLGALLAETQLDSGFAASFRTGFLARRRLPLRELLIRARERGEVASATDIEVLGDLLFGALWYRILSAHAPLDRDFADGLTDALLRLAG